MNCPDDYALLVLAVIGGMVLQAVILIGWGVLMAPEAPRPGRDLRSE